MSDGDGILDSPRAAEIDAVFARALDLTEGRPREAFLDRACAGDDELRREVEALLAAAVETDPLLSPGGARQAAPPTPDMTGTTGDLSRLGAYQLVREIGRGGMGTVYLAERADGHYEQRVALKVLRLGADSRSLTRFHRERQILARLEHPAIARLYDGGTTPEGDPYLVMEYVEGLPIDRYCREREVPLDRRLELFLDVCAAVQAAHRQLVVHHDVKPSNILVDGEGRVKLLDFGIALLLDGDENAATAATTRPLTPQYASPEQVEGRPTTVSSDLYQLGLLAYELLTDRRPYELAGTEPWQWRRTVCELAPPPPSTVGPADLAGDLDAIVLQALRKEPERRYLSVDMLRRDVVKHLEGRPVSARPDTLRYRLGKLLSRHRAAVTASLLAATAFLALTLAFILRLADERDRTRRAARQAIEERDRAERRGREAEQAADFLVELLGFSDPYAESTEPPSMRQILDRGAERVDRELDAQPQLRARLLYNLGRIYYKLGENQQARRLAEDALAIRRAEPGVAPGAIAESLRSVALLDLAAGDIDRARSRMRTAVGMAEAELGGDHADLAPMLNELGGIELRRGSYAEAESFYRRAHRLFEAHHGRDSVNAAIGLQNLGVIALDRGRWREAESLLERALAIFRRRLHEDHPRVGEVLYNLAFLHSLQGDGERALELLNRVYDQWQKTLGLDHPKSYILLAFLARANVDVGHYDRADRLAHRALAAHRERHGEGHPMEAVALEALGRSFAARGALAEAESWLEQALVRYRDGLPANRRYLALAQTELARVMAAQGRSQRAEELFEQSLETLEEIVGSENPVVTQPLFGLAELHHRDGRAGSAEGFYRRVLDVRATVMTAASPARRSAAEAYAGLLRELGREREAGLVETRLAVPPPD